MRTLLVTTKLWARVYISIVFGAIVVISAALYQRAAAQTPTPFLDSPYFGQHIITQPYIGGHNAYDFDMYYERVLVAADGTVDQTQWYNDNCHNSRTWPNDNNDCGYGLYIRINHGVNNYRTIYAHLSAAARLPNDSVTQGQIIGTSGDTGWSTAPHFHFQVQHYLNNVWTSVNPFDESGVSLWSDGEWASPSRPIPAPINGGERQVDDSTDNTGGFSKGQNDGVMPPPFNNACIGNCANWTAGVGLYGDMYSTLVNGSTPDSWAKWNAAARTDGGMYEVFVYIPSGGNAASWQAPYTIRYSDNAKQITGRVDQYGLENQWVSLGIYYMTPNDYVFITDATGEGRGTHCGAEQYCRLKADAVSFLQRGTTYLPYVSSIGGWVSTIIVRNNGGGPAQVRMLTFKEDGTQSCNGFLSIPMPAHGVATWDLTSCPQAASALVEADQDIAVVVENRKSGWYAYSYTGQSTPPTTGYLPQILQYLAGAWHTNIQAMNTGTQSTNITANFYRQDGILALNGTTTLANVAVNGSGDVGQGMPNGDTLYVGRMSAAQPVAGVVRVSDNSVYRRLGYSSIPVADTTVWLPFVMTRLGNNWGATIWIQNTSGTGTTATVQFDQNGAQSGSGTLTLPANGLATLNLRTDYAQYGLPAGWQGSAKVTASVPMAVVVNQLNDSVSLGASYEGIPHSAGSTKIVLPYVVRKNGQCYYSNFTARNLGGTAANLTIHYYDEAGTLRATVNETGVASEKIYNLYTSPPADLPQNFRGSVLILSTNGQPLAATSNLLYYYAAPSCTGRDDTISYTGVNR